MSRNGYPAGPVTASFRGRRTRAALAALGCAFFIVSCPASARDEADTCFLAKMRLTRVGAASLLSCVARADGHSARLGFCIDRTTTRLEGLIAAADQRARSADFDCPATLDSLALAGPSTWPLRFAEEEVAVTVGRCARARLNAARRYAAARTRCRGREAGSGPAEVDHCAADARDDFLAAWTAGSSTDCSPSASTGEEAAERIEAEIDESASRLIVRCGDGTVAGFEECDDGAGEDGDGCSANCRVEDCGRVGDEVHCVDCPDGAVPSADFASCRCPDGFEGEPGSCVDIDECARQLDACTDDAPCVNLEGTHACATACTAEAFHAALATCGAPTGAIAFDCRDTTIALPVGSGAHRRLDCDDLVIDGAGRGIAFESAPLCWQMPVAVEDCPGGLETDGTCRCPDVDDGPTFLSLRGDRNVVRDLTVRGFFDGIRLGGRDGLVERVRFERLCDDAFGSVGEGVGNEFRGLSVSEGCDKCSENAGSLGATDPDPRLRDHYNATFTDIEFSGCRTPVRMTDSGRFLLRRVAMRGDLTDFPCDGPRFSTASGASRLFVRVEDSLVENCRRGLRFGRSAEGVIEGSVVRGCALRGLRVAGNSEVSVTRSVFVDNGGNGSSESGFGGVATVGLGAVDLGGGALDFVSGVVRSAGANTLCRNFGPDDRPRDLDNATEIGISAESNWWCSVEAPFSRLRGPADVVPWLDRAP